jgi:2-amino-4-hydroxy-6-hydroxymethyldihydropteridine diphosphokinase
MGDPAQLINEALSRLETYDHITLAGLSSTYWTEPQGLKDQPWFCNQVAVLEVDPVIWSPEGVLSTLLAIEAQMGRERSGEHFGPRTIDLDIIAYGDLEQESDFLYVPHPRAKDRAFVLVPLQEVEPGYVFPDGLHIKDALSALNYQLDGDKIWQE